MRETMWKAKEGGTENPVYAYSIPRRTGTYVSTGYLPITTITEPQPCHGLEGLPVDVVANERQVEGQREPLASKHEQNVEQKVQKIFWQYLRKTKVIIITTEYKLNLLKNLPKLRYRRWRSGSFWCWFGWYVKTTEIDPNHPTLLSNKNFRKKFLSKIPVFIKINVIKTILFKY